MLHQMKLDLKIFVNLQVLLGLGILIGRMTEMMMYNALYLFHEQL